MKIGVVGLGMVGEAVAYGLRRVGHEVIGYDVDTSKSTNSIFEILKTELTFVCVPTPTTDLNCNTKAVWDVVSKLNSIAYKGLIVIKSTVSPGTTENLAKTFPEMRLAFCPEFLRERARFSDFVENHEVCIIGANSMEDYMLIGRAHEGLPKQTRLMTPTEAELAKYFVNCFNAYRVNFANAFYDVCKHLDASYDKIKDAVSLRTDTKSSYMDCNENLREFGGACLPKDTQAFATFVYSLGLGTGVFEQIVNENARVQANLITVSDLDEAAKKRINLQERVA